MSVAKEEMRKGMLEVKRNLKDFKINLKLDSSFANLKNDPSWNQNFEVHFDSNLCRVNISKIAIPDIQFPDFNQITIQIEDAMKNIPSIVVVPDGKHGKSYSFKYEYSDSSSNPVKVNIPNIDSILKSNGIFSGDSLLFNWNHSNILPDSLASIFKLFNDSLEIFNKDEFRHEMKQLQNEMMRMREEMKKLRIEIHQDTTNLPKEKKTVEI
jgi:hypothetical protein